MMRRPVLLPDPARHALALCVCIGSIGLLAPFALGQDCLVGSLDHLAVTVPTEPDEELTTEVSRVMLADAPAADASAADASRASSAIICTPVAVPITDPPRHDVRQVEMGFVATDRVTGLYVTAQSADDNFGPGVAARLAVDGTFYDFAFLNGHRASLPTGYTLEEGVIALSEDAITRMMMATDELKLRVGLAVFDLDETALREQAEALLHQTRADRRMP